MGLGKLQACPFPDVLFPPLSSVCLVLRQDAHIKTTKQKIPSNVFPAAAECSSTRSKMVRASDLIFTDRSTSATSFPSSTHSCRIPAQQATMTVGCTSSSQSLNLTASVASKQPISSLKAKSTVIGGAEARRVMKGSAEVERNSVGDRRGGCWASVLNVWNHRLILDTDRITPHIPSLAHTHNNNNDRHSPKCLQFLPQG